MKCFPFFFKSPRGNVTFVLNSNLMNWTDAQRYCRQHYTDLASVRNLSENAQIRKQITAPAWIGLYKSTWKWSNGPFFMYNYWQVLEPDGGDEKCTAANFANSGRWMDLAYHDATFVYVSNTMSWTAAQSYCREHHTDLASVRNPMENEKIKQLIPSGQSAWIGLYRDSWKWVDGTKPSITNWRTGEPSGLRENCAAASMEDGKWEDWDCTVLFYPKINMVHFKYAF
uniref:C-type lectin domain-containing protein n=1 Tax=Nothobranchius furzeri TaxID=105023 RepID=A0A8C6Q035_NOTFU